MRKTRKITKAMLMNCYDDETYKLCKSISRESTLQWLAEANRFFLKIKGIDKILEEEKKMREIGW